MVAPVMARHHPSEKEPGFSKSEQGFTNFWNFTVGECWAGIATFGQRKNPETANHTGGRIQGKTRGKKMGAVLLANVLIYENEAKQL